MAKRDDAAVYKSGIGASHFVLCACGWPHLCVVWLWRHRKRDTTGPWQASAGGWVVCTVPVGVGTDCACLRGEDSERCSIRCEWQLQLPAGRGDCRVYMTGPGCLLTNIPAGMWGYVLSVVLSMQYWYSQPVFNNLLSQAMAVRCGFVNNPQPCASVRSSQAVTRCITRRRDVVCLEHTVYGRLLTRVT
jgi:hypothetical protein